jgi:hypothetical protein
MDTEPREQNNRRIRRSSDRGEALSLQIAHVMEILGFDAIVLADDLGFPVVQAGDPRLADLLAQSAMWTDRYGPPVDTFVYGQVKERYPCYELRDVVSEVLDLPGMPSFCRLTAVGHSAARCVGVRHAADGIRRIWAS